MKFPKQRTGSSSCSSSLLHPPLFLLLALGAFTVVDGKGGELAAFRTTPFAKDSTISHRQDFCDRYQEVYTNNWELKDALNGVELHPVLQYGSAFPYFNYDPITGIDPDDPGLVAHLLDYIAEQANFTWRNSFGVYTAEDKGSNKTWTELLKWTTDTYDISIDKWYVSTVCMFFDFCIVQQNAIVFMFSCRVFVLAFMQRGKGRLSFFSHAHQTNPSCSRFVSPLSQPSFRFLTPSYNNYEFLGHNQRNV